MNIVGQIDPSAFAAPHLLHHRIAEFTPEFHSSASSRARNLFAMKAQNWMAAKAMPTARDYVQDGLVVLYDGIENVGWGVHDGTASAWVDLVGTLDPAQYKSGTVIGDDCAYNPAGTQIATNSAKKTLKGIACPCYEIVMSVNSSDLQSGLCRILDLKKDNWYGMVVGKHDGENVGIGFGNFIADNVVGDSYDGVYVSTYYVIPQDVDWTSTNSFSICHFVDASIGTNHPKWNEWDNFHPTDMPLVLVNGSRKSVICSYWTGDRYINGFTIGTNNNGSQYLFRGRIHCIRVYSRYLSEEERLSNYAVDKARFGLT